MFRGASKVTLDDKGRVAIPSRYRERITTRADGHLVVTVSRARYLLIYPLTDWEEIERKLTRLPALHPRTRALQGLMLGYATEADMDGHGRILVSRTLRDFARLDRQAMLIGQGNKFALWDEERWLAQTEEWVTEDEGDFADLPDELESLIL